MFMGRNLEFSYQKLEDKLSHNGLEFNHFEAEKITAQCNLKYPLTQLLEVYIMRPWWIFFPPIIDFAMK